MTKVPYDTTGVDRENGQQDFGEPPKPGVYLMKIQKSKFRLEDGKNDIQIILEVMDENDQKGRTCDTYVGLGEAAAWRLAQLLDALKLPAKGELNEKKLDGKLVMVKLNSDTYQGAYRPRVGLLWAPDGDQASGPPTEDEPNAEDLEPEDAEPAAAAADAEAPEDEEDDYPEWTAEELKEELEKRGLRTAGPKTRLIARLRENDKADDDPFE
jgi:hypothetical protein